MERYIVLEVQCLAAARPKLALKDPPKNQPDPAWFLKIQFDLTQTRATASQID